MLIGHDDHEEVEGTVGEAPERDPRRRHADEVDALEVARPRARRLPHPDDARRRRGRTTSSTRLRDRFPDARRPGADDICYATQNRQDAVRALAAECDLVLVVGSRNSSNSNRLVEVAAARGCDAHLVDDDTEIDPAWLVGAATVGVTAGASAPEALVERVVGALGALGPVEVEERDGR